MAKRKVCVVTGSRADFGLLRWLMDEIRADGEMQLQVVCTGSHLSSEFDFSYREIEEAGFPIDAKVEMLLSSDTGTAISKSVGLGVMGLAGAYSALKPDVVVLLGDRFEILAAATAATLSKIPVAHIHGGETTEGAIDDQIRHAITKLAHFHFTTAEVHRKRVIQMGESPERVQNFGSPGIDNIHRLKLFGRSDIEKHLGFELGKQNFLVTYHPVTLANQDNGLVALFGALMKFNDAKIVMTQANSDEGGRRIKHQVAAFAKDNPNRVCLKETLGNHLYLSLVKEIDVVIGNSSSGLIEVAALGKPCVNIGDRQKGRLRGKNVLDVGESATEIEEAIHRAMSPAFRDSLQASDCPYGTGDSSRRIKDFLRQVSLGTLRKPFFDLGGEVTV